MLAKLYKFGSARAGEVVLVKEIYGMSAGLATFAVTVWALVKSYAVANGTAIVGGLITAFFAFWFVRIVVAAFIIWRSPKWWHGKNRFTVTESACILWRICPSRFDDSDRAKALATDILAGVRGGHIRVAGEAYKAENIGRILDPIPSMYPKKPDADYDTTISKNTLEGFAKNRKMTLPWAMSRPTNNLPE